MLGAPFWSVVTINAGFIGMAAEACSGRVSPFWIIAPLAYFAGYSVAVVLNHQAVDAAVREMAQRQARADLPFPAAGAALVVDAPSAGPLIGMTQSLVRDYSIPVVYERAGRATPFSHIAYRLGAAQTCLRSGKRRAISPSAIPPICEGTCASTRPPKIPSFRDTT